MDRAPWVEANIVVLFSYYSVLPWLFQIRLFVAGLITGASLVWVFDPGPVEASPTIAGSGSPVYIDETARFSVQAAVEPQLEQTARVLDNLAAPGKLPPLEQTQVILDRSGRATLPILPQFNSTYSGRVAGINSKRDLILYSLNPELQRFTEELVKVVRAPHAAIVAMEPKTGRILAIADKSNSIDHLSLHAGFPAASLFKLVTATAALEQRGISPDALIKFRGGTYSLDRWNYLPDFRRDTRSMAFGEALGRSCNPVFGRIALQLLNPRILRQYTQSFGFNSNISGDIATAPSSAYIPQDEFDMSRTAAGFGDVFLSPLHAAALMSGIANDGLLPRPALIEQIREDSGKVLYQVKPTLLSRVASSQTTKILMKMMENTVTVGTSRREFMPRGQSVLPGISVAAKTGTLRGTNPLGLNNWFIAAAPIENPKIAISVVVVDPSGLTTKASHMGRMVLEKFFTGRVSVQAVVPTQKKIYRKATKSSAKYKSYRKVSPPKKVYYKPKTKAKAKRR